MITKHKLNLGQLFKLYPQLKDRPKDSHLQLSEVEILVKAERDMSLKEYPSFRSLHNPLHIYFNILMHQLIVLENQFILMPFTHGFSKYMAHLYKCYLEYKWPQVLK